MWIIIKTLLNVFVTAPFFALWFFVDTAIGFVINGWEELKPKKVGGLDITV